MSELPQGWETVNLGEVAEFEMGQAPPGAFCNKEGNGTVFVKAGEFGIDHPQVREWTTQPLKFAHRGDVLICVVGATSGKLNLGIDCAIGRSVAAIRPSVAASQKIIYRQLQLQVAQLRADSSGTAQGVISKQMLADIQLVLPPVSEQTRIANQLDTLLTRVQACNDRFDAILALLKRFRQTVLDACFLDDQLAVPVEKSIQPWALRTVGSVCASISDGPFGSNLKSADYTSAGVQVVRLENIGHLFFDAEKETFISAEKYKTLSKHTLKKGDLLFSSFVDEEVRVCEFPIGTLTINKADCFRLRVDETQCNRHFLLYRLACKSTYQSLKDQVHGATRPRINLTQLRGYEILLPPLAKQAEIVRRVEALFALADRIEAGCTAARTQAQRLTPLVLAKAFRGELVPQDSTDEPASVLLARIGLSNTVVAGKNKRKVPVALMKIA